MGFFPLGFFPHGIFSYMGFCPHGILSGYPIHVVLTRCAIGLSVPNIMISQLREVIWELSYTGSYFFKNNQNRKL